MLRTNRLRGKAEIQKAAESMWVLGEAEVPYGQKKVPKTTERPYITRQSAYMFHKAVASATPESNAMRWHLFCKFEETLLKLTRRENRIALGGVLCTMRSSS